MTRCATDLWHWCRSVVTTCATSTGPWYNTDCTRSHVPTSWQCGNLYKSYLLQDPQPAGVHSLQASSACRSRRQPAGGVANLQEASSACRRRGQPAEGVVSLEEVWLLAAVKSVCGACDRSPSYSSQGSLGQSPAHILAQ